LLLHIHYYIYVVLYICRNEGVSSFGICYSSTHSWSGNLFFPKNGILQSPCIPHIQRTRRSLALFAMQPAFTHLEGTMAHIRPLVRYCNSAFIGYRIPAMQRNNHRHRRYMGLRSIHPCLYNIHCHLLPSTLTL